MTSLLFAYFGTVWIFLWSIWVQNLPQNLVAQFWTDWNFLPVPIHRRCLSHGVAIVAVTASAVICNFGQMNFWLLGLRAEGGGARRRKLSDRRSAGLPAPLPGQNCRSTSALLRVFNCQTEWIEVQWNRLELSWIQLGWVGSDLLVYRSAGHPAADF